MTAAPPDEWVRVIDIAERLQEEQKLTEARAMLLVALDEAARPTRNDFRLAYTWNNLGSVAQDQGRLVDAQSYYRRSLGYWELCGERANRGMARTLNNLASLLHSAGKTREARELLLRAEQQPPSSAAAPEDPAAGIGHFNRATVLLSRRDYSHAEASYRRAAALLERNARGYGWELGQIDRDLGTVCEKTGRQAEAAAYYASARRTWESRLAAGPLTPQMALDLASLYVSLGQPEHAIATVKTTVAQWNMAGNPPTPAQVSALRLYARLLRKSGRKSDAAQVEEKARSADAASQAKLIRNTVDVTEFQAPRSSK